MPTELIVAAPAARRWAYERSGGTERSKEFEFFERDLNFVPSPTKASSIRPLQVKEEVSLATFHAIAVRVRIAIFRTLTARA